MLEQQLRACMDARVSRPPHLLRHRPAQTREFIPRDDAVLTPVSAAETARDEEEQHQLPPLPLLPPDHWPAQEEVDQDCDGRIRRGSSGPEHVHWTNLAGNRTEAGDRAGVLGVRQKHRGISAASLLQRQSEEVIPSRIGVEARPGSAAACRRCRCRGRVQYTKETYVISISGSPHLIPDPSHHRPSLTTPERPRTNPASHLPD